MFHAPFFVHNIRDGTVGEGRTMSVRDDLLSLVQLQAAELLLAKVEAELEKLPAARSALEGKTNAARAAVKVAKGDLEDSSMERRRLEGGLQDVEQRIEKYRDQELLVKTNEQLWAIQAEIKTVQNEIVRAEEGILEEMERADQLGIVIEARQAELQRSDEQEQKGQRELEQRQQQLDSRRAELEARVNGFSQYVPEELRERYERVKRVRLDVGVAECVAETCLACNFKLRPQLYLEVRNLETVCQCDNCSRLLFSRASLDLPSDVEVVSAAARSV